jgi:hypothetical protein
MKLPKFTPGVSAKQITHLTITTIFLIVFLLLASATWAHGIADQVNDPEATTSWNCGLDIPGGFGPSMFQSFTPTAETLAGVDLRLRGSGTFPDSGLPTTIWIHADSPGGATLGTATTYISTTGEHLVHFDFDPALATTPGETYVIEWSAHVTETWFLGWLAVDTNPYPGGNFFGCFATPDLAWDFNFITYSEGSPPIAHDDTASTTNNTPVTIDVAANDTDPDGDLVLSSVAVTAGPANGSAASNGDGTVTYTPTPGFSGADSFTYQICDATGLCGDALVTVDVAHGAGDAPAGRPDEPGEVVPDNPAGAADHANEHACDNPGGDYRPGNVPPCR